MQPQRGQIVQTAARLVLERTAPVQQQALQVNVPVQRCQPEIRQRQATAVHGQRCRVDQAHGGAATQVQGFHTGPIAGTGARQRQRALQAQLQPVLALPGGSSQLMLARRAVQAQVQRIQNVGARAQLAGRQRQLHGRVLPRLRLQGQRRRQIQLQVLQAQAVRLARLVQDRPVHTAGTRRGLGAQILKAPAQVAIQIHAACSAAIQCRQVAKLHADIEPILRGPQCPLGLDAVGRAMSQLQVDVLQRQRLPLGIQLGLAVQAAGQRLARHAAFHQIQPHRGLLARRHQAPFDGPVRAQHPLTPGRVNGQRGRQPLRQVQPAGRAAQVQVPGSTHGRLAAGRQQRLAQRNPPFVQFQPARVQRAGQFHLRIGRQLLQVSRQQGAHLFGALRQIHQELLAIHLHLSAQSRPGQPLPERGQIQSGQLQVTLQAGQRGPRNGHRLSQPAFQPPLDAGFALGGDGHGLGSLRFLGRLALAGAIARFCVGRDCCHGPGVSLLHAHRQADGQVVEGDVEVLPLSRGRNAEDDAALQRAQRNAVGLQRARPAVGQPDESLPRFLLAGRLIDVEVQVHAGLGQLAQRGEAHQVGVGQAGVQTLHRHPAQRLHHGLDVGHAIGQLPLEGGRQSGQVAIDGQGGVIRPLLGLAIGLDHALQTVRRRTLHLGRGRTHLPPGAGQRQRLDPVLPHGIFGCPIDVGQHHVGLGILTIDGRRLDLQSPDGQLADLQRKRQAKIAGHVDVGARLVRVTGRHLDDQCPGLQLMHQSLATQQRAQRPAQLQISALDRRVEATPFHAPETDAAPQVALQPVKRQRLAIAGQKLLRPGQRLGQTAFAAQPQQRRQHQPHDQQQDAHAPAKDRAPQGMLASIGGRLRVFHDQKLNPMEKCTR